MRLQRSTAHTAHTVITEGRTVTTSPTIDTVFPRTTEVAADAATPSHVNADVEVCTTHHPPTHPVATSAPAAAATANSHAQHHSGSTASAGVHTGFLVNVDGWATAPAADTVHAAAISAANPR